jgi:hypothetical protein
MGAAVLVLLRALLRHSETHILPIREILEDSCQRAAGCALAWFLLLYGVAGAFCADLNRIESLSQRIDRGSRHKILKRAWCDYA